MANITIPSEINNANKHIYATFAEMAQHNFFVTMQYIYEYVLQKKLNCEDMFDFGSQSIWNTIFSDLKELRNFPEKQTKLLSLLYKHFSFLDSATTISYKDVKKQLSSLAEDNHISLISQTTELVILEIIYHFMRVFRNSSRHSIDDSKKQGLIYNIIQPYIISVLNKLIVGHYLTIETTDRKGKVTTQEKLAEDNSHYFLRGAINILKDRFGDVYSSKDYNALAEYVSQKSVLSNFQYVMFICLFIEKSYVKQFCDKIRLFAHKNMLAFEMISVFCAKMPSAKYEVSQSDVALALDILNELQKCPKELYDHLKDDDRSKFRIKDENDEDVFMVRKRDRFAQLVLQYIDTNKIFDTIRFQVSLGRYRHTFYNKKCIDGVEQVRILQDNLNGFGRLSEMDRMRIEKYGSWIRHTDNEENFAPEDTIDSSPYVTDHHAKYIINGNIIGLWWKDEDEKDDFYLPELGGNNIQPKAWLSVHELPAMMFLIKLYGIKEGGNLVEKIIKNCVDNYHRLFGDIASGNFDVTKLSDYGIKPKDVPHRFEDINTVHKYNKTRNLATAINEKKTALMTTIARNQKYLEKSPDLLKTGKIASFLCRDLLFWMKKGTSPTGKNFSVLQNNLAIFKGGVKNFKKIFDSEYLINENGTMVGYSIWENHPFIKTLSSFVNYKSEAHSLADFAKEYLSAEISYLKRVKDEQLPFYEKTVRRQKSRNNAHIAHNYKIIGLPNGIFEDEVRKKIGNYDTTKNTSFLINDYLINNEDDNCQDFYSFSRNYKEFDDFAYQAKKNKKPVEVFYDGKERESVIKAIKNYNKTAQDDKKISLTFLLKNESWIKLLKLQDIILFWMAKQTLLDKNIQVQNFKLSKIDLSSNILSDTGEVSIKVVFKDGNSLTICQSGVTLKNYSTLYRLVYDRRLYSLAKNLPANSIVERIDLEHELDCFDRMAIEVTKLIIDFEDKYHEKYDCLDTGKKSRDFNTMISLWINKPSYFVTEAQSRIQGVTLDERQMIIEIRNAFNHWSYPQGVASVENISLPQKSEKVKECFEMSINNITLQEV